MALQLANVALSDTFDAWRIRTNQIIAEAGSSTSTTPQTFAANTTFSANVTITGVVSAATVTANTLTGTLSTAAQPNITSVGALNSGSITSGFGDINIGASTVTAGSFVGDGSGLTNAGSTVATGTNNADLNVPFTGITSGTMTSANVDVNFTYNPSTGTVTANNFVGDGSGLTGLTNAGATVAAKSDNVDYKVTFTNQLNGAHANTFVNTSFTFNPSTGDASATNFNSTSDAVWKEEITPIENASQIISRLSGKAFNWVHTGQKSYGVIAQEVESVLPDVVVENTAGKAVNYNTLIAFLIESNKELQQRIQNLENNK